MAMQGNLQDMAVADLIQHNCQDRKTAQLVIDHDGQQAALFFKEGAVQHATLGEIQGEEVVYQILNWQNGQFSLEVGPEPPAVTIDRSWSGLLLEGARRLDEASQESPDNLVSPEPEQKEETKRRSDYLAEALTDLLHESSDLDGAAVVGLDGLVFSAHVPQDTLDESLVGATAAAIMGLSQRSADQLKRGDFKQTLIQGDKGNIIVAGLDDETFFVGLTAAEVNLGVAFAEVRMMVTELKKSL